DLPGDVPTVLHGHVHALAGLRAVGVAGVAGDEHAWPLAADTVLGHVVELVGEPVGHLVDTAPPDVFHPQRVGMDDRVGSCFHLFLRRRANRAVVVLGHGTEVDVHPEEMIALAGNVQDVAAVVRLDGALGANIREVGVGEHVHHAPGVFRVVPGELAAERVANAAVCTVAADHVRGAPGAYRTFAGPRSVAQPVGQRTLVVAGVRQGDARVAEVRLPSAGRVVCGLGEVVEYTSLVDDQVGDRADPAGVVRWHTVADD